MHLTRKCKNCTLKTQVLLKGRLSEIILFETSRSAKGSAVNFGGPLNKFDPAYHDNVDVFYPERRLTNSKTKESITQDVFVYIPFSSDVRNCIGQYLSMNEVRVIFSLFLKKYDFELDPDYKHQMIVMFSYEPLNVMNSKLIPK